MIHHKLLFSEGKKGGKRFIIDLKMGGQYFSWQHRWGSDLFHRKIIYHIFPNPGQGIEISKIGEIGASAFLIGWNLIGEIFQSRFSDYEISFISTKLVSGGQVENCSDVLCCYLRGQEREISPYASQHTVLTFQWWNSQEIWLLWKKNARGFWWYSSATLGIN